MNNSIKNIFITVLLLSSVCAFAMDGDNPSSLPLSEVRPQEAFSYAGHGKIELSKQEKLNKSFWGCFVNKFYHDNPDSNHFEAAQSLLDQKADINYVRCFGSRVLGGETALEVAWSADHASTASVIWLLERGADDTANDGGFYDEIAANPHHKSVIAGYYENKVRPIVEQSLPVPKSVIDLIISKMYITAVDDELFEKAETASVQEIAQLLARNADPNTFQRTQFDTFHTPLKIALRRKDSQVVKLLLEHGANPNIYWHRRAFGDHPFRALSYLAYLHREKAGGDNLEKLRLLLEHNADPHLKDVEDEFDVSFFERLKNKSDLAKVFWDYKDKIKNQVNKTFFAGHQKNDDLANIVADYVV